MQHLHVQKHIRSGRYMFAHGHGPWPGPLWEKLLLRIGSHPILDSVNFDEATVPDGADRKLASGGCTGHVPKGNEGKGVGWDWGVLAVREKEPGMVQKLPQLV
ncbi:hypothetical protein ZHAS_00007810 [Anopheles sinensis]|uniref:Uncharacterized protein n=1 Tax=Anopheles sinensis TaxID=74873 RepID=A0A084VQS7_ANOSI|nr:hypothetical protein ZHAS_00007810 [Anopheles sinensis]